MQREILYKPVTLPVGHGTESLLVEGWLLLRKQRLLQAAKQQQKGLTGMIQMG